jgi:hypothetical protein
VSAIQTRAKNAIEGVAESFTVSGNTRQGWIRICSYSRALLYATPAEVDTYARPLRLLLIPHDDPTTVGDTVLWNSLSLGVKKAAEVRFRGEVIAKVLLIA